MFRHSTSESLDAPISTMSSPSQFESAVSLSDVIEQLSDSFVAVIVSMRFNWRAARFLICNSRRLFDRIKSSSKFVWISCTWLAISVAIFVDAKPEQSATVADRCSFISLYPACRMSMALINPFDSSRNAATSPSMSGLIFRKLNIFAVNCILFWIDSRSRSHSTNRNALACHKCQNIIRACENSSPPLLISS